MDFGVAFRSSLLLVLIIFVLGYVGLQIKKFLRFQTTISTTKEIESSILLPAIRQGSYRTIL